MATEPNSQIEACQPLAGLAVVEIGHSVAAPFAGHVLGDLGATVLKIENPDGGDDTRTCGPPFLNGTACTFNALNRNKHSIAIDRPPLRKKPPALGEDTHLVLGERSTIP